LALLFLLLAVVRRAVAHFPFAPWFFVSPNNSDSLPLTRSKTSEIGIIAKVCFGNSISSADFDFPKQQAGEMRRIGVLLGYAASDPEGQAYVVASQDGLRKLGWTEDRNIRIDARWGALDAETMQRLAKELVALADRKNSALLLRQETAALRHFIPGYVACGSKTAVQQPPRRARSAGVLRDIKRPEDRN
jgi:hypothetical protein